MHDRIVYSSDLVAMDALIELCDLIAQSPALFSEKLSWICSRCPPSEAILAGSPAISRSQLNAVLAVARLLSKCPDSVGLRPKSVVLEFLRSIPLSFSLSFWPQSYGNDAIASFFNEFLNYTSKACELSTDFATEVSGFSSEVVLSAINDCSEGSAISRAFLVALSKSFLPIIPSDADKLVSCILDRFLISEAAPGTPREHNQANSEPSSSQSSPLSVSHQPSNGGLSPGNENGQVSGSLSSGASRITDDATSASSRGSGMMNGNSILWKSGLEQFSEGGGVAFVRQQVALFEDESIENLEKQEIAFKLMTHILDNSSFDGRLWEQMRALAKKQLQTLPTFLKVDIFISKLARNFGTGKTILSIMVLSGQHFKLKKVQY